MIATGSEVTVT